MCENIDGTSNCPELKKWVVNLPVLANIDGTSNCPELKKWVVNLPVY